MTNVFFNNYSNVDEQQLIESLIIESIGIYGHDLYFCPRSMGAKDEIYGEDDLSTYDSAYDLTAYIRSYDSYEGDGSFLSKFNLEIRDQITFTIARTPFLKDIGSYLKKERPLEGDLLYSKMMKRLFIIKYVNFHPIFYQMGALQTWDLTCEVFEYSNERINTGIEEIDNIEKTYSVTDDFVSNDDEYEAAMNDVFATNREIQDQAAGIIDWTESDPFSLGNF